MSKHVLKLMFMWDCLLPNVWCLVLQNTAGSVENALKAFVTKEEIDGYTCPSTKQQLDAHRRLTFEELPPILILHLKCFVYDKHGGSQKIMHKTKFSDELVFEKGMFLSISLLFAWYEYLLLTKHLICFQSSCLQWHNNNLKDQNRDHISCLLVSSHKSTLIILLIELDQGMIISFCFSCVSFWWEDNWRTLSHWCLPHRWALLGTLRWWPCPEDTTECNSGR